MTTQSVTVSAPARLHMGFMDMNGDLGRNFGSLGLTLADIATSLTVTRAPRLSASGPRAARARAYLSGVLQALGINAGVHLQLHSRIPEHVGLGSGTQLALAVSTAVTRLFELDTDPRELACMTDRGVRSGIGIGAFEHGGFLVDGGRGEHTTVPPVISHVPFPEPWRILLIFDNARQGLNGTDEKSAFRSMPPMSAALSAHLCRLVLMRVLPALAEMDFDQFSTGITEIQEAVGDHFAQYQGGRYSSPLVAGVLNWLREQGVHGVGQSSWGPTGFALVDSEARVRALEAAALDRWAAEETLSFMVSCAQNHGAEVLSRSGAETAPVGACRA